MTSSKIDYTKVIALRESIPQKQTSYWSNEEKAELETMFYKGVGITEMALHFSRSEPAISKFLATPKLHSRICAMATADKNPILIHTCHSPKNPL